MIYTATRLSRPGSGLLSWSHHLQLSTRVLFVYFYAFFFFVLVQRLSASHISFVVTPRHSTPSMPSSPSSFCHVPTYSTAATRTYQVTAPVIWDNILLSLVTVSCTPLRSRTAPMTRHTALLLLYSTIKPVCPPSACRYLACENKIIHYILQYCG